MPAEFFIEGRRVGADQPPYIIAELSANHNGSFEQAKKSIEVAKSTGAHAVKLQTYTPDTMTINCDAPDFLVTGGLWDGYKLYDLYQEAFTPFEWHKDLFDYGKSIDVTVFSTPFDESAVDLLEELETPVYKVASFELMDLPLIQYIASTGKPIIMSTGMGSELEIQEAIDTAYRAGCKELALLHCISSYPTPINKANLRTIPALAERFKVPIGLSDHTLGITATISAISQGACIIEKHFTISRQYPGPDSRFSIEPQELTDLVQSAEDAWLSLGSPRLDQSREAEASSKRFRRSIYFVQDLPAGATVGPEDIRRIRPGMGLPPKMFDSLIGRRLKKSVSRGTATREDMFE
jgi:N-acetylneuraminate synthase